MLLKFQIKENKENIPLNHKTKPNSACKVNESYFLPKDLLLQILLFLTPHEITQLKYTNTIYHSLIDLKFWNLYNYINPLKFRDLYTKKKLIIQRRSKGNLYQVTNKLNNAQYILRVVNTVKANANCNDGVQTSLLRELSYLHSIPPHPNIIEILAVNQNHQNIEILYPKMPYTLKDRLKHNLPIKSTLLQVCQAIHYLHSQHIMHRNIKLDNILLNEQNQVKLSDFALSRLQTYPTIPYTPEDPKERERSNREIHRLWYRAPELLFRKTFYSEEVDIWSLGCVFAEMVLGRPLFKGKSEVEYLFSVMQLIGCPMETDWNELTDSIKISFPKWTQFNFNFNYLTQKDLEELSNNRPQAFAILQELNRKLDQHGLELLQWCLSLKRSQRPSIEQVITHPYLNGTVNLRLISYQDITFKEYLDFNPEITQTMRATLIDWMTDVAAHFTLSNETLHLAVTYLDLALGRMKATKQNLQLIGVSCLKISDVYNEISREFYMQENSKAYAYVTADEYQPLDLINMEAKLLKCLGYRLTYRTALHYINMIIDQVGFDQQIKQLAYFYCDYFLMTYDQIHVDRKLFGLCCIILAIKQIDIEKIKLIKDCGYNHNQINSSLLHLERGWNFIKMRPQTDLLEACISKYQILNPRTIILQLPTLEELQLII